MHGNIKTKTETPLNPKTNKPIYQSDNGLIGYRKSIQFAYNPNNELKQTITIIDTGLQVQRITTQYHYDAFGRRIAKNSKTQTLNKLNQNGKLVKYPTTLLHLRKTDKTEHQTTLMLWEGNRQIQEYTNHHIFTTVYDQDSFEPVSRLVQSRDKDCDDLKIYHYHNNHLGTPQELTDDCGNVVWCNYEFAWGGRYTHFYKKQSLNNCDIIETDLQPIRFQGQFFDTETSLHYNRFRYYDSDVGMFISRDPIGLLGGNNVFQYAPNPIGWVDPWGLSKGHGNYKVSANTALPDVESRGVHVNVSDKKTSMHVEIVGIEASDGLLDLEFKPADPTAKTVSETSKWKKITESIRDFLSKPSNREKLANVADVAFENFPDNSRDFKKTSEALRKCV